MKRFIELDILRFFAASWVVLYHFAPRLGGADALEPSSLLGFFSRFGYLGVDLFFIISGFVILLSTRGRTWHAFLLQRSIRLFPSYWAALFITVVATGAFSPGHPLPNGSQLAANLTMLPGYLGHEAINGVYWTLAVEWKFYLLMALLLASPLKFKMEIIACSWLVVIGAQFAGLDSKVLSSFSMFPYGSYFAYGMLLCFVHEHGLNMRRISFVILGIILSCMTALRVMPGFVPSPAAIDVYAVVTFTVAICVGFLALVVKNASMAPSVVFRFLGATTYPLYMLHGGLGYPLLADVRLSGNETTRAFGALTAVALTSVAMAWGIEMRLVPWLSRKLAVRDRVSA